MKRTLYTLLISIVFFNTYSQNELNKTVRVSSAGWKRVIKLNNPDGRGYNEVTLTTKGGATSPTVSKISWFKGWSNYGGLHIESLTNIHNWTDARITYENKQSYLEVNFKVAIAILDVHLNQAAWSGGAIIEGSLPNGGGSIITSAKFGKMNVGENALFIGYNNKVGIGTANPDSKLAVNGNIHTKEVKVDLNGWADFVFDKNYNLPSLQEVEKHIQEKGHLAEIPSTKEVKQNGIKLGEINKKLLQKIEELTLYTIQQQKEIEKSKKENNELLSVVKSLTKRIEKIEKAN